MANSKFLRDVAPGLPRTEKGGKRTVRLSAPGPTKRTSVRLSHHHGIVPFSQRVNVPVGPSAPSSATRTASRAPSSTVSVPAYPLRFVLVKPGETALTLIPSGSNSIAMAIVNALRAVLDAG